MSTLNIAICQIDIAFGQPEQNEAKIRESFAKLAMQETKPDVVLFPELWNTGYDLTRLGEIADAEGQRTKALMGELARKHDLYIIAGSIAEKKADGVYNTTFVFAPDGQVIHEYRKAHLFRLMDEEKFLAPGQSLAGCTIGEMPALVQICYDIRFPESIRSGALAGAEVLFVSAEWPHPRLAHWRQLLIARAIENQMYVVACNRAGNDPKNTFCGHSLIIDPWGEIVAEAGEAEEIITGTIDRALVADVRSRIPIFADRRTDLYDLNR